MPRKCSSLRVRTNVFIGIRDHRPAVRRTCGEGGPPCRPSALQLGIAGMTRPTRRFEIGVTLVLAFLILLTLPLFLCLPPYSDNDFYGLAATIIRRGGVLERDMRSFYFPPGFAWLRAGIDAVS